MSRVATAPTDDGRMWRRLLARTHPDHGGDHDLFVWTMRLREQVVGHGGADAQASAPQAPRVVFVPEDFDLLTRRALDAAHEHQGTINGYLLMLLNGCINEPIYRDEQTRGASYRRLAKVGHLAGMTREQRSEWYRIAESVPLSDAHARYILGRLGAEGRAAM